MGNIFKPENTIWSSARIVMEKENYPKSPDEFGVCRRGGGFGLVKGELDENMNTSPVIGGEEGSPHEGRGHL